MVDDIGGRLDGASDTPADERTHPTLPHLLAALDAFHRRLEPEVARRMRSRGTQLRGSHARILGVLPPEGARPSALAEGWISRQAIGMRVHEMAEAGLVSVEPDPDDRRATIVRRTAEGDRLRSLANSVIADVEAALATEVGSERYRVFREVLDELAVID